MKRLFLQSIGYNLAAFVFGNKMVVFDCETLEQAKAMDISGIDGCQTVEEAAVNCNTETYDFREDEWETITEI